jgi:signal transduction histidine kinase
MRWLAIAVAALSVGLVSLRIAQGTLGFSYLSESPAAAVVGLAAGWGLVAVGLETLRRRRHVHLGLLLAFAGVAWFVADWSDPTSESALVFTVGLALGWLYPAIVGHALFTVAGSKPGQRLGRLIVASGYGVLVIGLGIVPSLSFDPPAVGCGLCPANLIDLGSSPAVVGAATSIAAAFAVAWAVAAALVLGHLLARSGRAARRMSAPVMIPGMVFLAFTAASLARAVVGVVAPTDATDHLLRLAEAASLVALAIGVCFEWILAARTRGRVTRLVADLAESPPVGGLRDHLAAILQDPTVQLAYPTRGGEFVNSRGRPVSSEPRPGRMTTPIVRAGAVVAVIEHSPDVLVGEADVDEVATAARLGLEHERLQAEARAQLDALRAARRRIVETGDARRRQLERDLHDGAQQDLITLSINLRLVKRSTAVDTLIDAAAAELRLALDDLREVAHGIYPTVLGDEGFAAAVDAVAETSAHPIVISAMVEDRYEQPIEAAAYHVVADAARAANGPLKVAATRTMQRLRIEVSAIGISEHVAEEIADRVGAVDGTLTIVQDADRGMTLIAELPCGS